ncbi:MAG: hypothetical protein EBS21_10630 [Sphingomonadaceae bacterium]|jgi:hypothetical protein|nr:hypothetical protein [Sphingomonadaceae bacterium]
MFWSQTNRRFVLGMLGSAALAIASGVQARDQAKKGDTAFTGSVANSDTVSKIGLMYCQGQLR